MRIEHPTGSEYAQHLQDLAEFFELPIRENPEVLQITNEDGVFRWRPMIGLFFEKRDLGCRRVPLPQVGRIPWKRTVPPHCNSRKNMQIWRGVTS
ncbi:MAG: hypothetical protein Ct9H90mP21_1070 [Methanobacteriota archaeon]|nr:MAG: hypothetical protein Ct9H90mP21_1070 [Euryarchaeota archaeon]